MAGGFTVDFSPLNPNTNQTKEYWNAFDQGQQRGEQRNFGKLVQQGDLPGALKYATATGNVQGAALINNQQDQADRQLERQRKIIAENAGLFAQGAYGLKNLPMEARANTYKSVILPGLRARGIGADIAPDDIDYSDSNLDAVARGVMSVADQYKVQRDAVEDQYKRAEIIVGADGAPHSKYEFGDTVSPSTTSQTPVAAPQTTKPAGISLDSIDPQTLYMKAIEPQESGGRAGILGPQTKYGRAMGASQMLPATAQAMAQNLGIAWDPALMRDKTAKGLAYQRQLGVEYTRQAIEYAKRNGGDVSTALSFYHGGPNQNIWGHNTSGYAARGLERLADGSEQTSSVPATGGTVLQGQLDRFGQPVVIDTNTGLPRVGYYRDGIQDRAHYVPGMTTAQIAQSAAADRQAARDAARDARADSRDAARDAREADTERRRDAREGQRIASDSFRNESTLRGDYEKDKGVVQYREALNVHQDAEKAARQARAGNGVSAIALLYAGAKAIASDGSVIRPEEFKTISEAQDWYNRNVSRLGQLVDGNRLTPKAIQNILDLTYSRYQRAATTHNSVARRYAGMASQYGLDPSRVVAGYDKNGSDQQRSRSDQGSGRVSNGVGSTFANPATITSRAQFDKLPSGTFVKAPNGRVVRKP